MTSTAASKKLRRIRSFVRREGRFTAAQRQAITKHWSDYGIDFQEQVLPLGEVFCQAGPVTLEIGFGRGDSLFAMAQQFPEKNFLGVEVHGPGVGSLIARAAEVGLTNLKVIQHDAVEVLQEMIPDQSIAEVLIFFPDPWPKKRHHKRRLIQVPLLDLLAAKLQALGMVHVATDWQQYGKQIQGLFDNCAKFRSDPASILLAKEVRCKTKYEQRGERLGHQIWDLVYRKV